MAADLDMSTNANLPYQVIAVATNAVKKILLSKSYRYVFKHSGIQSDGSTAAVSTDYVVLMDAVATMAATAAAGKKHLISADKTPLIIDGKTILAGADGNNEVQVQAAGNGAMLQIFAYALK